jgi:acyl-CoA thioester hydrolase
MFSYETQIRVRYSETDQMGYVYYGNYAGFYEVGRVELLRSLGMTYKSMEENGIMLPVSELKIKYIKPAFYDELIMIKTTIPELPQTRIKFLYEAFNEKGVLLNLAETTLVFVDMQKMKPTAAPETFLNKLRPYFIKTS